MTATQTIDIDVVSDVVCPWCFVGMKRLEAALATLPAVEAHVRWRPFQLDATIPASGVDRNGYMLAKFGNMQRVDEAHKRLEELGAAIGIDFNFSAIAIAPNTLDAHRLVRWAGAIDENTQNRVVAALFSRFFERGQNIGDPGILIDVAKDCGMDVSLVAPLLPTDADRDAVRQEIATVSRMGISGVPCFLLGGKYAVMGAQDTAVLANAIAEVAAKPA